MPTDHTYFFSEMKPETHTHIYIFFPNEVHVRDRFFFFFFLFLFFYIFPSIFPYIKKGDKSPLQIIARYLSYVFMQSAWTHSCIQLD